MEFLKYLYYFVVGNPALYAAILIPICFNRTVLVSLGGRIEKPSQESIKIRTWVDIAGQIASIIALVIANLYSLVILSFSNDNLFVHATSLLLVLYYFKFFIGFKVTDKEFEIYKLRPGIKLPPITSRIARARYLGFLMELVIPASVYIIVKCINDVSFKIPIALSTLQLS